MLLPRVRSLNHSCSKHPVYIIRNKLLEFLLLGIIVENSDLTCTCRMAKNNTNTYNSEHVDFSIDPLSSFFNYFLPSFEISNDVLFNHGLWDEGVIERLLLIVKGRMILLRTLVRVGIVRWLFRLVKVRINLFSFWFHILFTIFQINILCKINLMIYSLFNLK